jgi:SAM-dependent methyltransferase
VNSEEVRRRWAERSGEFSPEYYAYYGPDERSEAVSTALTECLDRTASVLELGCSSGRHLAHLAEEGFDRLHGVEVNGEAFDVMAETYPDLAEQGTFYHDTIEDVTGSFDDGQFDAVYSVETLQHIHPNAAWVFDEIARITDGVVVTVENEGGGSGSSGGAGGGDGSDGAGGGGDSGGGDAAAVSSAIADDDSPVTGVNYVNDEFPLYYRDWSRVFERRGATEVESDVTGTDGDDRDTVHVFRTGGGAGDE